MRHLESETLRERKQKGAIRVWEGGTGELVFSGYRVYVGEGEEIWRWKLRWLHNKVNDNVTTTAHSKMVKMVNFM